MASGTAQTGSRQLRWYQGITRYQWIVLVVAALGWLFDTMDQNLFNLVRLPALKDLLTGAVPAAQVADQAKHYGGIVTAIFLIGWAAGGFIFGVIGDRLGRARTMMVTIGIYALFTGLSAVAQTWEQFALFRFLTALGVGGEFAAGAALVAETWPDRSRPMALGMLQALSAVGNMTAAIVNLLVGNFGGDWRLVFLVGTLPALLVVWIWKSVKEPDKWVQARAKAEAGGELQKEFGAMSELLRDPALRRNTLIGATLGVVGVGGVWGIAFWSPDLLREALRGLPERQVNQYVSYSFFAQQLGAFIGMYAFTVVTERTSRRFAFALAFALAFLSVQAAFQLTHTLAQALFLFMVMGFCTLGPFAGYCIYFPELFPTRLRATGCGVCYNAGRFIAAAAPFTLGTLSVQYGLRTAASTVAFIYVLGILVSLIAPETRGKPLPD